jgi:hypothetical protein
VVDLQLLDGPGHAIRHGASPCKVLSCAPAAAAVKAQRVAGDAGLQG